MHFLRALIDALWVGAILTDAAGRFVMLNKAAEELLESRIGATSPEPEESYTLYDEEGDPIPVEDTPLQRALQYGEVVRNRRLRLRTASGHEVALLATAAPLYSQEGALTGAVLTFQDAGAHENVGEITYATRLLRNLVQAMPVGVVTSNVLGGDFELNPEALRVLGSTVTGDLTAPQRSYTVHLPDGTPFPPEQTPLRRALVEQQEIRDVEVLVRRADGTERSLLSSAAPVRDDDGEVVGGVSVFQDISSLKKVQAEREALVTHLQAAYQEMEQLAENLALERDVLQVTMENTTANLAYLDKAFNFVQVNAAYAANTGYPPEELVGRNHFDLFPNAENQAIFEQVRDTGETISFQARPFTFPDDPNTVTYWDWTLAPVKSDEGEVRGLVLSLRDVTRDVELAQERETLLEEHRQQHELLEQLLETAPVGVAVVRGPEYRYEYVNPAYRAIPGMPDVEMVGRTIAEVFPELAAQGTLGIIDAVYITGETQSLHEHTANVGPGREETYWDVDNIPLRDAQGNVTSVLIVADEVTAQVTARQQITTLAAKATQEAAVAQQRAAEQLSVFQALTDAVVVYDAQGVPVQANPAAITMYGLDPVHSDRAELAHSLQICHRHGDPVSPAELPSSRALQGETVTGERYHLTNTRGEEYVVVASAAPLWRDGEITGIVAVARDVTEREELLQRLATQREELQVQQEELLSQQEELRTQKDMLETERVRLRAILDALPVGVFVAGAGGELVDMNAMVNQVWGGSPPHSQSVSEYGDYIAWWPESGQRLRPEEWGMARALQKQETSVGEEVDIRRFDGTTGTILNSAAPIYNQRGELIGAVAVTQDITEIKKTREQALRYARRLQTLRQMDQDAMQDLSVEAMAKSLLRHTPELIPAHLFKLLLFDHDACNMRTLSVSSAPGDRSPAATTAWERVLCPQEVLSSLRAGEAIVVENLEALGTWTPFQRELYAEGVRAYVLKPLLIHERLLGALCIGLAEPERLDEEEQLVASDIANQVALALHQAQLHQQVRAHADKLEEQVKRRTAALQASNARFRAIFEETVVGMAVVDLNGRIRQANPALQQMVKGEGEKLQGQPFTTYLHPDDVAVHEKYFAQMAQGEVEDYQLEERYQSQDGEICWIRVVDSLVRDPDGKPRFVVHMAEDITAERMAQEALVQTEKLSLTGRMAASLAHEINNPVQTVVGCLLLAQEDLAEDDQLNQYLTMSIGEVQRIGRIVSDLRDLNRRTEAEEKQPGDVVALLEQMLALSSKQASDHSVEVLWSPPEEALPLVPMVRDRLHQVFLNLTLNAIDAMPGGGELRVDVRETQSPAGVAVSFADTGVGIDSETLPGLFDAFYTTKKEGLGLGLYITHNIITDHGGHIDVESVPGEGTTFTVWLPAEG